jgi:hypothetical protein
VPGHNPAGHRRVRTKLPATGESVGVLPFLDTFGADHAVGFDDSDGSGVAELPSIGETASG